MKLTFNSADIISWKNYYQNYVLVKRHDYRIGVYLDFTVSTEAKYLILERNV